MLTLQMGIDPKYVLDEMRPYEIAAVMRHSHLRVKDGWEQARLVAQVVAQCNSRKPIKPTDIAEFVWDEKRSAEPQMKGEEYERLRGMAQAYARRLNEKNDNDKQ